MQLFERERELGWLPLNEAFDRLCVAVPELAQVRARAEELAASPGDFGIVYDAEEKVFVVPSGVLPTAHGLVGPESHHDDPLIRSSLAATVAARYVSAVIGESTHRAAWEPGHARLQITGSITFGRADRPATLALKRTEGQPALALRIETSPIRSSAPAGDGEKKEPRRERFAA